MSDADSVEPPSKRVKLSYGSESPRAHRFRSAFPGYIPLARHLIQVDLADGDLHKILLKQGPRNVQLLKPKLYEDTLIVLFKYRYGKTAVEAGGEVRRGVLQTAHEILLDCHHACNIAAKEKADNQADVRCKALLRFDKQDVVLDLCLLSKDSVELPAQTPQVRTLISRAISKQDQVNHVAEPWNVKEFYDHAHVPDQQAGDNDVIHNLLQCQLYPFQRRAVRWLLRKEGVQILPNAPDPIKLEAIDESLPLDFQQRVDADGYPYYASNALNVTCSSRDALQARYADIKGGVLAEAMGLGKTVEMIALMCAHQRAQSPHTLNSGDDVRPTQATLIITPPSILWQWWEEIKEHAPALKVTIYTGLHTKDRRNDDAMAFLADQDVVLTTYNIIAKEVHYVRDRPDRQLRNRARADPPKSPLTQFEWWRVLLDEAQMIESGVSAAAEVAQLIPRVNAWAVTGTPLKQSHRDLYGLMLFLRQPPWSLSPKLWDDLVHFQRPLLRKLISSTALRHSKELVVDELRIPPQLRRTVVIPFSAVEETHYGQLRHDMQEDVGLDSTGAPLDGEWDPDDPSTVEKMRGWLLRLRQTCLHPEVGSRNKRALGRVVANPLRTVAQVLDVMIEQAETMIHTEQRNYLVARTRVGQLLEHARDSENAQKHFKTVLADVELSVRESRKTLDEVLKRSEEQKMASGSKEEQKQVRPDGPDEAEEVDENITSARQRLRALLEVQHVCLFFIGNTFFQLKESQEKKLSPPSPDQDGDTTLQSDGRAADIQQSSPAFQSEADQRPEQEFRDEVSALEQEEVKAYDEAKQVRAELLVEVRRKAQKFIFTTRDKKTENAFVNMADMNFNDDDFGGIESRKIYEKLHWYMKAMNTQAEQFGSMRARLIDMLCRALVDEDEGVELTGAEYEDSTKTEDEMYVVMEIVRALFADRQDAISGQENLLTKQETKGFLKQAKEGEGHAPELMIKLLSDRAQGKIDVSKQGSLRGIISEIRALAASLEYLSTGGSSRAGVELSMVKTLLQSTQKLQAEHSRNLAQLEQEVEFFRNAMNARLDYYRALQKISDTVAPYGEEDEVGAPVNERKMTMLKDEEARARKKLETARSKQRYLLHLKNDSDTSVRLCTICQYDFDIGTLTVCGHQFCKDCIQLWWREHHNCPVCKKHLKLADFFDVTYKPIVPVSDDVQESERSDTQQQSLKQNAFYSMIPKRLLNEIQSMEINGASYGSKVDTINRHILHLRQKDPGSKTIIFSQYRDFLDVLSRSLRQNGIIHSRFDDKDGITDFKSNPISECFLLHAKAQSAGLNLVCASHVILCEPLINTAIELQAVARVHRIGQQRSTTVWMYLISGTVEEAIYNISVQRRLAHMGSSSRTASRATTPVADAIEAANAKELQQADLSRLFAAGKSGGEQVDKQDLWECLFGNTQGQTRSGVVTDLDAPATSIEADSQLGRLMRAEAAESRRV